MNKIIIFIVVFTTFTLYSQKKDSIIVINPFGANKYPLKNNRYGNTVKFKITNVNVFKLTGGVSSTSETSVFEIPKIFKETEGGIEEEEGLDKTEERSKRKKRKVKLIECLRLNDSLKKIIASQHNFIKYKNNFIRNLQKINNFLSLEEQLKTELKDSIFIRDVTFLKKNTKAYYNVVFEGKSVLDNLKEVDNTISKLLENYSLMKFNYNLINKTLEKEEFKLNGELKGADKKTVLKVVEANIKIDRKKLFEEEMTYASKLRDSIAKPETQKLIKKKVSIGVGLYKKIQNEKYEVFTKAHQLLEDVVTLTPKLLDAKGKEVYSFNPLQIKTRYKWKVNFSSGYLLNFKRDESFSYKKDTSGIIGVKESEKNKINHALGGLIHAYFDCIDGFQPALSAGLSVNSNGNLGFYSGVSFLFTEKNRLVISMGYSLTSVKTLDRSNLDTDLKFVNTNDIDLKYNDVYKGGLFIGLTYNLAK
ncbi:hypothetical protein CXF68_06235 [Tenacibaculum sp. Bg11-29]|uniref:hypothetical protein n=1 Tax=Tenacibaculum sp. Bg11-29 TaxID=2058306 RepID=UPI000C327EAD|nr:hypothetical protein [Tenacibaculum sp. Bg11-29]PKH50322.1 hypothetical protein CXF68_06235 [Tenacibaculum sp. Bg11-29]